MLAGSALLYSNLTLGKDVIEEIDALLAKGKNELEPCRQFKEEMSKFSRENLSSESPSHASKQEALAVLALLETYPGTPPSHYKAARLFDENHELFLRRVDQVSLMKKSSEVHIECDVFFMMKHGQMLLKDTAAFAFNREYTLRARRLIASYLKAEFPVSNLIAVATRGVLLQTLLETSKVTGHDKLAARAKDFLEVFEKKRLDLSAEREKRPRWQYYLLSYRTPELRVVRELNDIYGSILADAKI